MEESCANCKRKPRRSKRSELCDTCYAYQRTHGGKQRPPEGARKRNVCSVSGCERPAYGRGWCRQHYGNWRRNGHPVLRVRRSRFEAAPLSVEFWQLVDQTAGPDACWPWTHTLSGSGYGRLQRDRHYAAHRVAYQLATGVDPGALYVLHRCDNPPCCNPAHLFLGTNDDNMADMAQKGRAPGGNASGSRNGMRTHPDSVIRGSANRSAKLSEAQVREIRARHPAESSRALAAAFGVGASTVKRILRRESWTHVAS